MGLCRLFIAWRPISLRNVIECIKVQSVKTVHKDFLIIQALKKSNTVEFLNVTKGW